MSSHVTTSAIFRDFYSTSEMSAIFDDQHLVQCWLDVEAALARAQAKLGVIPAEAAEEITCCANAANIDMTSLQESTNLVGYPIVSVVRQLATQCSAETGRYIHWGATTQDIMDSGTVLQLRSVMNILDRDLGQLITLLSTIASEHRTTPMAGRTHGQHALPITFGYKVAVWIDELARHQERFSQSRPRLLRSQFSGAVGTLASLGEAGWEVHTKLSEELGLAPSAISWHTARDSFGEFVSLCGLLTATLGKMAHEIATLQRNEVAEAAEPFEAGKGSSSTMPQKRNPILCEAMIGIAQVVAQHVPTMLTAMKPEHERAMGEWHAEWDVIPHVCQLTGAALAHGLRLFDGLIINQAQMARNLDLTNGQIVSEAVMMSLGSHLGRQDAHHVVYQACNQAMSEGRPLYDVLSEDVEIMNILSDEELKALLDPANYVGLAPFFVDQVLQQNP